MRVPGGRRRRIDAVVPPEGARGGWLAESAMYYIMRLDVEQNARYSIESRLAAERAMAKIGGNRMDLGELRRESAILVLGNQT